MFCEVLAFHDSATECVGAGVPVPVSVSVVVEGCALLVKVRVALTAPEVSGLKVMVKFALVRPPGTLTMPGACAADALLVESVTPLAVVETPRRQRTRRTLRSMTGGCQ